MYRMHNFVMKICFAYHMCTIAAKTFVSIGTNRLFHVGNILLEIMLLAFFMSLYSDRSLPVRIVGRIKRIDVRNELAF